MICYDIKNNYNRAFLTIWGRLLEQKHTPETEHRITSIEIHSNIFSHYCTRKELSDTDF